MECQIVPNIKHVCENHQKVKKHRNGDYQHNQKSKKTPRSSNSGEENTVYILQPMFKPPKSTNDIVNKSDGDNLSFAVKAISDSNKDGEKSGHFNHFTMSRKGVIKLNTVSRVEDPIHPSSDHSTTESPPRLNRENAIATSEESYAAAAARRRASYVHSRTKLQTQTRERRRASSGCELIKNSLSQSRQHSARLQPSSHDDNDDCSRVVIIGPDEVLLIPAQRRPSVPEHTTKRGNSAGKAGTHDNRLQPDNPAPRRKSFHDWCSMQEWYLLEPRPISPDSSPNTRRNVISPNTLSRLLPNTDDQGPRQGSASISVCTEGDRMSYNFNLPSRRLVSHKDLKNCSLPYNDNIGLEETVSSDQARKVVKSQQSMAVKKRHETDRQTPKQVWYRTVRSILAANHLYHSVKRKNQKMC